MASEQCMKLVEAQRRAFIEGYVELTKAQCHEWALECAAARRRQVESSGATEAAGADGADGAGVEASDADNVKAKIQQQAANSSTIEAKMVGGQTACGADGAAAAEAKAGSAVAGPRDDAISVGRGAGLRGQSTTASCACGMRT